MFKRILSISMIFLFICCAQDQNINNNTKDNKNIENIKEVVLNQEDIKVSDGIYALLDTEKGNILIELYYKKVPLTVLNFIGLAEGKLAATAGKRFYDGLTFHRVVDDFIIQGGDPLGDGTGGPGYSFYDEFDPSLRHDSEGILSMANSGPNTNGSQFFITFGVFSHLDDKHSVFGKVIEGMDVVKNIIQDDKINKVNIIKRGQEANDFEINQDHFNQLIQDRKDLIEIEKQENLEKIKETIIEFLGKDYKTDENGIMYSILKEGKDQKPQENQTVQVHYTGKLLNGFKFDSSYDRNEPIEFQVGIGYVIPGWDISILDMNLHEKRKIVLPPELAYGDRDIQGIIPAGSFLYFEMELIEIKE